MRGHHEEHQTRFYAFFALALAQHHGRRVRRQHADPVHLLRGAERQHLSARDPQRQRRGGRAGRVYLGILLGTSIGFQLLAIGATWVLAGTLDFAEGGILAGKASDALVAVLMALYLFGIGKAAVMPFHRWLPAAMVAPTPVSALLHAVAVVKAGVFAVLKVVVYVFGLELLRPRRRQLWLAYVAAATIIIASLVAMTQDNLKLRLAYSTVSQLVLRGARRHARDDRGRGRRRHAHRDARVRQDHPVLLRRRDHGREPQDRDQRDAGPWPAHAVHLRGVLSRLAQHHRAAADGRRLEQVGAGARRRRDRAGGPGRGPDDLVAPERRLSDPGRRARVPAGAARERRSGPDGGWRIEEAPLLCVVPLCLPRSAASRCSSAPTGSYAFLAAARSGSEPWRRDRRSGRDGATGSTSRGTSPGSSGPWPRSAARCSLRRLLRKHGHFAIEHLFGFYGLFGFVACVVLVLAAKWTAAMS